MKKRNAAVIGLGYVGKTIAYSITKENLFDEIYLIDINDKLVEGEVKDLNDGSFLSYKTNIKKGKYSDLIDNNVEFIFIAAGLAQGGFKSRLEQTDAALKIFDSILKEIQKVNYNGFIIVASNPVDILTYYTTKYLSYIDNKKIIGTGTLLDTNRYKNILGEKLNVDPRDIDGFVLGEHGAGAVPLFDSTKIKGFLLNDYLKENSINIDRNEIEDEVKKRGFYILQEKGSTYYGVSECASFIVKNIIDDKNINLSLSVLAPSKDFAYSYLVNLNKEGAVIIENQNLSEEETKKLEYSKDNLVNLIKDKNYKKLIVILS